MERIVRRLRVLEYIGTEDFIAASLDNRAVKGMMKTQNGTIREALLGDTNELLGYHTKLEHGDELDAALVLAHRDSIR